MPPRRKLWKKRPAARRRRPAARRRRLQYVKRNGYVSLMRKCPEIICCNQSIVGALTHYSISGNPAANVIQFGTPVLNTGTGTYDVPFCFIARLDQVYNYTELTNFADEYKIKKVYLRLYYQSVPYGTDTSVTAANNANMLSLPSIEYVYDDDDFNVPSVASFRERMGVKRKTFKNYQSSIGINFVPKVLTQVESAAGTGLMSGGSSRWIDTDHSDVEQFGVKGIIKNMYLPSITTSLVRNSITWDFAYAVDLKNIQ